MTGQPAITATHTWDGPHHLPDWLHWDGTQLALPGRDDTTQPGLGWTLVQWSDGHITVASPQVADRVYGPDGIRGRLERAEAELAALVHNDWPAGTRWLHIVFTSPDPATANTSALNLRDHLAAEFPGVGMRISSNATEIGVTLTPAEAARLAQSGINTPGCDCGHHGMGESWHGDTCDWKSIPPCDVCGVRGHSFEDCDEANNPAATEATGLRTRVTNLFEQWVKAGPPPLGVPTARWWDRRLVELGGAIRGAGEQPARTTAKNPPKEQQP